MNTSPGNRPPLGESELTLSGVINLSASRDSNRIPLTSALQLSLQVTRLVAETHDRGQIVGVLDAAHLVCAPNGAMSFGGTGGNPMAPELKRGDMPDRLTDVYALGALMYRLLTGRRVEQTRIIEPPSHFNPAVDTMLDDLVLCALDEDPSERPYSARDLEQRLLAVYEELGLEADSKTEATKLIEEGVKRKPVSDAPPKKVTRAPPVARVAAPELTVDTDDAYDDEEDFQPQIDRNPLEKKWLIGGGALLALFLIAFLAWPSSKKPVAAFDDDVPAPAKTMKTASAPLPAPTQVKLIETTPTPAPEAVKVKKVVYGKSESEKSPKKSTRRARR